MPRPARPRQSESSKYSCPTPGCERRFANSSGLTQHIHRVHTQRHPPSPVRHAPTPEPFRPTADDDGGFPELADMAAAILEEVDVRPDPEELEQFDEGGGDMLQEDAGKSTEDEDDHRRRRGIHRNYHTHMNGASSNCLHGVH